MTKLEPVSVTRLAERLGKDMLEVVWQSAKEVDEDALSPETAQSALLYAVQQRLAKTHATLLIVQVGRKRRCEDEAKPKVPRVWRPTRPELAHEAALLLQDDVGLTEAPLEKRASCLLPLKFFAKTIAAKLEHSTAYTGLSSSSIGYAVGEVISAVFTEAERNRLADRDGMKDVCLELHRSTDAAWKGTAARGSGIAMNAAGRELVAAAVRQVAKRLAQPAMLRL